MASVAVQSLPQALPLDSFKESITNVNSVGALAAAVPTLRPHLSEKARVYLPQDELFEVNTRRFSDYKRPLPGAVVCVADEQDIVATVKWANANSIKFLAQSGSHGWAWTLSAIGPQDIVINLRGVNDINIDMQAETATFGAGATTGELLNAAQAANCHVVTAAHDDVGAVSSTMGGGFGTLISSFGLAVDNMISARVVTSNGSVVTASRTENSDLFWGLRGVGHNYGIVTELTVKTHPQINGGEQWSGMLGFSGSQETAIMVLQTIEDMGITRGEGPEGMSCTVVFGRPSPNFEPTILLKLSFNGPASAATSAFTPLYTLTTTIPANINTATTVPANTLNNHTESLCPDGGHATHAFRPVHSASLPCLSVPIMTELYRRWEDFTEEHPEANESMIRINCYDFRHVRDISDDEAAFAWRDNPINVLQYWSYTDETLHDDVERLGTEFRLALTGDQDASVIMNFASGIESPETVYGGKLEKLRALKEKWDSKGAFSFFNPV